MPNYVSVADLRARYPNPFSDAGAYPDGDMQDAIDLATEAFEHAAGIAFTPRTETVALTSSYTDLLRLPRAHVTAVSTVTGSESGSIDVDGQIIAGGIFRNATPWTTTETLTVEITYGLEETPKPVIRAVEVLARHYLIRGSLDDRATQLPSADGGVINLSTPGFFGATFGIPYVDQVLEDYRDKALV